MRIRVQKSKLSKRTCSARGTSQTRNVDESRNDILEISLRAKRPSSSKRKESCISVADVVNLY